MSLALLGVLVLEETAGWRGRSGREASGYYKFVQSHVGRMLMRGSVSLMSVPWIAHFVRLWRLVYPRQ